MLGSCGEGSKGSPKGIYGVTGFDIDNENYQLILNEDGTCSARDNEGTWTKTGDYTFDMAGMGNGYDGKWTLVELEIEEGKDFNDTMIEIIAPGGTGYTRHTIK